MCDKVLFVDDEPLVLNVFQRARWDGFEASTAVSPEDGLSILQADGPFSVVVSDLKMPGMDGFEFLGKVRAMSPDTACILLTGFADLDAAVMAANAGHIFRLLTKPCPLDVLSSAIAEGITHFHLVASEKELLEGTLSGTIRVLTQALSVANPYAHERARRITELVHSIAQTLGRDVSWELNLASTLSHIGCMGLPPNCLEDMAAGQDIPEKALALYESHPSVGAGLLKQIPRMEAVAAMVAEQNQDLQPQQPEGARFLKVATDYDLLISKGLLPHEAYGKMLSCKSGYEPAFLGALGKIIARESEYKRKYVPLCELNANMALEEDIVTRDGLLIMAKSSELSNAVVQRLLKSSATLDIVEPVAVRFLQD